MDAEAVLRELPEHVRTEVHEIWKKAVRGGGSRFKANRDGSGGQGQRRVSSLIQKYGVKENSLKWIAVRDCGREHYYGES